MAIVILNTPGKFETVGDTHSVLDHFVDITSTGNIFTNKGVVVCGGNFTPARALVGSSNFQISNGENAYMRGGNGIVTAGNGGEIFNFGTVIAYADDGIRVQGGSANVNNFLGGVVKGVSDAIEFAPGSNGKKIVNDGTLLGKRGVHFTSAVNAELENGGVIHGDSFGVLVAGAGAKTISNARFGLIDSSDFGIGVTAGAAVITNDFNAAIGGFEAAIVTSGTGRVSLDNKGVVDGSISCTAANGADTIVNSGDILGDVDLGPGNDTFVFAGGTQGLVKGGGGADRFDFKAPQVPSAARIDDFTPGVDTIGLSKAVFKKIGKEGPLKAKFFHVGKKAADKKDHVIWNKKLGAVFYDPDGKGGASQELLAVLDPGLKLNVADFIVIA